MHCTRLNVDIVRVYKFHLLTYLVTYLLTHLSKYLKCSFANLRNFEIARDLNPNPNADPDTLELRRLTPTLRVL